MKIVVGSDHGGYDLKEALRRRLEEEGHEVQDVGCHGEPVDYPDIAVALCKVVTGGEAEFGILCCGTGIGISMAANKIKGIRAALCADCYSARMAKEQTTPMSSPSAGAPSGWSTPGRWSAPIWERST